jgi:hypothetical protein
MGGIIRTGTWPMLTHKCLENVMNYRLRFKGGAVDGKEQQCPDCQQTFMYVKARTQRDIHSDNAETQKQETTPFRYFK